MSNYYELLLTEEWNTKRLEILARDKYRCTDCKRVLNKTTLTFLKKYWIKIDVTRVEDIKKRNIPLQVHHKHYIIGKAPWEYSDNDLITLCGDCHQKIHDSQEIPVFKVTNKGPIKVKAMLCSRCNGTGGFPEYEHVESGRCFRCNGNQYEIMPIR